MKERKNITLDVDSAIALMQEIYNDTIEQKSTATMILKKMINFMKDAEDMSIMGPVIKEQQKIINECIEKKVSLVKLYSILTKQGPGTGGKVVPGKLELTDDDREMLERLVNDGKENKDPENYKL